MKFRFKNFPLYLLAILLQIVGVYALTITTTESHTVLVMPLPSSQIVTYHTETHPYTLYGLILIILALFIGSIAIFVEFEEREEIVTETPQSFFKRCAECGKEIPIASQECPYCGVKQKLNKRK